MDKEAMEPAHYSIENIKKWFDLNRYEGIGLDLTKWQANLDIRFLAHMLLSQNTEKEIIEANEIIRSLLVNPLFEGYDHTMQLDFKGPPKVRDITASEVYLNSLILLSNKKFSDVKKASRDSWFIAESRYSENLDLIDRGFVDLMHEKNVPIYGSHEQISVDISVPDEILILDFTKWLKQKRGERGMKNWKRQISNADMKTWIKFRVLPYIDIKLLARLNNSNITTSEIGEILFPSNVSEKFEEDIPERIRKVVDKHARDALSIKTFDIFEAQLQKSK